MPADAYSYIQMGPRDTMITDYEGVVHQTPLLEERHVSFRLADLSCVA